jgi:hypothetical protein
MIFGILIFIAIVLAGIYLLYKVVQIVSVLILGVVFISLLSVFYITAGIAGGLLFVLYEQFGGNNFGWLMIISISVALLIGIGILKAMINEAKQGKERFQKWLNSP